MQIKSTQQIRNKLNIKNIMSREIENEINNTNHNDSEIKKRIRVNKNNGKEVNKKRKLIVTVEEQPDPRERRRERNRLLARRTRLKAKNTIIDLKKYLEILEEENEKLRRYCRQIVFPPQKAFALGQGNIDLPVGVLSIVQGMLQTTAMKDIQRHSFSIMNSVSSRLPIVYVSDGYMKMFGYQREEILGRNGLFLANPDDKLSDNPKIASIKCALMNGMDNNETLITYCKGGKKLFTSIQSTNMKDQTGRTFLVLSVYRTMSTDENLLCQREKAEELSENLVDMFAAGKAPPPLSSKQLLSMEGTKFKFSPLFYNRKLQDAYLQKQYQTSSHQTGSSTGQCSTTEEEVNESDDTSTNRPQTSTSGDNNYDDTGWELCTTEGIEVDNIDSWRSFDNDITTKDDINLDFDSCCF